MATFIPDRAGIRYAAISVAHPLVKDVMDETLAGAKRYVRDRKPRPYDDRPTGRLKRSLKKQGPVTRVRTISGRVGSNREYAMSVHDGARPHRITARRARLLSFWWEERGVRFAGRKVAHPGVRPHSRRQFLWLPLNVAAKRHNFKTRRLVGLAGNLSGI